ncbi:hypothetical protein BC943DRAFT_183310 [Umbelopsis sp. AD052]|nr:hypothetical protein BC943DRAFT_183310 [Umbelopsis sp. AD052]
MMMDNPYRTSHTSDQYSYHSNSYYNNQSSTSNSTPPLNQDMYSHYRSNVVDSGPSSPWGQQSDTMSWQSPQSPTDSQQSQRGRSMISPRPKLSTHLWEDEGTICYQVDARSICVARRQDNDMINGTKLLNVVGMSRGKRDGILKNEKGRVVVKVGSMHLKGVWITFARAKALAAQYKIIELLYPLFVDDPSVFLYMSPQAAGTSASQFPNFSGHYRNHPCLNTFNNSSWDRQQYDASRQETRSQMSPVSAKSAKLGTPEQSSRMPLGSHEDLGMITGMEYRNQQATSEHPYRTDPSSPSPGMTVGGLVRPNNSQYQYSQMQSGAPPDQCYPHTSYSQSNSYSVGLPPLVDKSRKTEGYSQENIDNGLETGESSGPLYVAKNSNLRNSGSYIPSMTGSSPPSTIGSKNDQQATGSAGYSQALPPMGSQQSAFYLFSSGGNTNMPNKEMQGYENGDMNTTSRTSGFVDVRRQDVL